jgi:hypothetical protein
MRSVSRPAMILAASLSTFLSTGFSVDAVSAAEVARVPWFSKGTSVHGPGIGEVRYVFPQIAANRRLDAQFVSCGIREPGTFGVYSAFLGANNALSSSTRRHLLPWVPSQYPGSTAVVSYDISQPIVMSFNAGERPQVGYIYFGTGSGITFIPCSLSGELVFLQ